MSHFVIRHPNFNTYLKVLDSNLQNSSANSTHEWVADHMQASSFNDPKCLRIPFHISPLSMLIEVIEGQLQEEGMAIG